MSISGYPQLIKPLNFFCCRQVLSQQKLYDYVRYDLKEIAFPSSLVDPPHIKKRRKLTWHERFLVPQRSDASRGVFVFSDMNPYVGHQNPLKEGQELLRKGLLSEAVLALEAEVMKNPENAEGWRLLGITHAENDDDQQVIHFAVVCQSWIVRVYSYTKRHCFCVL
ncbi:hypothetical protein ES332_A01G000900v1 [Gossypium tomentosum]|uniref:Peroxin-5 n=1 Tax=Gossypium tomentosum TaxID=34277 RepID=A0A5D2RMV4_GOSTO|nr:hypothetical protein ES332_A01G000900v1 [Gossypium tomentosum]